MSTKSDRFVVDFQPVFAVACILSVTAWTSIVASWADLLPEPLQTVVLRAMAGRRGLLTMVVVGVAIPLSALVLSYRIEVSGRRVAVSRWFGIRKAVYELADIVSVECHEARRELGKRRWYLVLNLVGGAREGVSPRARGARRLLEWLRVHAVPVREYTRS